MGGKTTVIEGNRISNFQLNNSAYGLPVPLVLGTSRIAGNVIDWVDFTTITHEDTQRSGKGGGSKTVQRSYTYTVAAIIGLCEGPVTGVGQIWKDKDVLTAASLGVNVFTGTNGQSPWNYMTSKHSWRALAYSGLCYVAGTWDLGSSGSLPNLNFEVKGIMLPGDGIDVNPAEAVKYIITDSLNGVGFGMGSLDLKIWQQFKNYADAAELLVSLPLTERKKAFEIIKDICECANVDFFWSQNKLKFVVKAEEQQGDFFPNKTPWYELTADDFLPFSDGSLVKFSRKNSADAYNAVSVEFTNRYNAYQKEQANYMVTADIAKRGMRQMPKKSLPYLHNKERAEYVARILAQESLFIRVKYTFRLGWTHCLLEPGDFVTLTDESIGLTAEPVIIEEIIENTDGELECTAYGRPDGVYNPPVYDTHHADRPTIDYGAAPGVHGYLTEFLTESATTVKVRLYGGQLLSGSEEVKLFVDGEVISYKTVVLTSEKSYTLTEVKRGVDFTIPAAHDITTPIARLYGLFRYDYGAADIGKTVYLKFVSFNVFGVGMESIENVTTYRHVLQGCYVPLARDLRIEQHLRDIKNSVNIYELELFWTPPANPIYRHAEVYIKCSEPNWDEIPQSWEDLEHTTFEDLSNADIWQYIGLAQDKIMIATCMTGASYTAKVVSVCDGNFKSEFDSSPEISHTVGMKLHTPLMPQNFSVQFTDTCIWSWDESSDTDVDYYELRLDNRPGELQNLLLRTKGNKVSHLVPERWSKVYFFAHNPSGKYSPPNVLEYYKSPLKAPQNITVHQIVQGLVITCDPLPNYCFGINIHIDDGKGDAVHFSSNNSYVFKGQPGVFDIQIAYVDLFGECEKSPIITAVIEPWIDPELLKAESISLEKMDKYIKDSVQKAQDAVPGTVFNEAVNQLSQVDEEHASQITQTSKQISSVITELNKPLDECAYTALVQTLNELQLRAKSANLISLINICPEAITLNSSLIHITGNTLIDDNVIVGGMIKAGGIDGDRIKAGSITTDKLAAGAITADKINVGSLTAEHIKAGSLTVENLKLTLTNYVVILTGTVRHGQILPLPEGFYAWQCKWMASIEYTRPNGDDIHEVYCRVDSNRLVTVGSSWGATGTAHYFVIGVK